MNFEITDLAIRKRLVRTIAICGGSLLLTAYPIVTDGGTTLLWTLLVLMILANAYTWRMYVRPPGLSVSNGILRIRLIPGVIITTPTTAIKELVPDGDSLKVVLVTGQHTKPKRMQGLPHLVVPRSWFSDADLQRFSAALVSERPPL